MRIYYIKFIYKFIAISNLRDLRVDSIAVMLPGPQSKVAGSIPLGGKLNLIVRTRLGITKVIQDVRSVQ